MYAKENGEIHICVEFIQLNRVTKNNSYPVSRADGPQQKLVGKGVFSTIDLQSAYWQFPMQKDSVERTAFSPGPSYGLWECLMAPVVASISCKVLAMIIILQSLNSVMFCSGLII